MKTLTEIKAMRVLFLRIFLSSMVQRLSEVTRRCSLNKGFLKISQNLQENTCVRVSFLIKLQGEACNFIKKETLVQMFLCEFCKIFKDTFFIEHFPWLLVDYYTRHHSYFQYFIFHFFLTNYESLEIHVILDFCFNFVLKKAYILYIVYTVYTG